MSFATIPHEKAETLDTVARQKILRLVVQEIQVGNDTLRIRHSIPVALQVPEVTATGDLQKVPLPGLEAEVIFCVRGLISPLLANIYLHNVFDLWVEAGRKKVGTGDIIVVRYADDLVMGFENRADADRFLIEFRTGWPSSIWMLARI